MRFLTGIGYDVHQLVEGRPLVLGGVSIPHSHGLSGHSDADVLCHAIADAILGALGLPDIGYYFPPTDSSIEGISSLKIIEKCKMLANEVEAKIQNIDCTLIAEAPKIMPYVSEMKEKIGNALGLESRWIGIKATTNETIGFVGRKEGIAAIATASIVID